VKVVLPGGSGEIGTVLTRALTENGHEVVVLSRDRDGKPTGPARRAHWDGATVGPWAEELEGAGAILGYLWSEEGGPTVSISSRGRLHTCSACP
jgi:uncharacterized protein